MENILKTQGLTKRFGRKTVVNEINMTIDRGEIYGFIGKNGAGKTTFMRLVLGLALPDSGTVSLFDGLDRRSAGQKLGSIIESPAFYGDCGAHENLRRFSLLSAVETSDRRIDELIEMVGLKDAADKKAAAYSLGMKQRLGLAVAMLGDPEFLVMDEPVNGLDPAGIKDIRDAIRTLNSERGVTFLISSHLLDELSKIATKYGIINEGVLVEEISSAELEKRFRNNLTVTVDRPREALEALSPFLKGEETAVHGNDIIIYYPQAEPSSLNRALVESGFAVSSLHANSGDIEDFFIERIGR